VPDLNPFPALPVFFALSVLLVLANNALAYIGPGAGLEQVGYAMSLMAVVGVAFSAVLLWPFYAVLRLFRRRKGHLQAPMAAAVSPPPPAEGPAHSQ
jgi:hypothetical protein